MILLDSLYINNSGGKILLDYLVETLETNNIPVFYLFDERCRGEFPQVPNRRKVFMKANLISRHSFYVRKKKKFSQVFCFGNLAPTISLDVPVYTYFHQLLFLDVPDSMSVVDKVKVNVKMMVLNALKANTNIWFVQSQQVKTRLASKYNVDIDDVRLLPFYPPLHNNLTDYDRRKDAFVYISSGSTHKNHSNLIEAFCKFYNEEGKGILHLTISEEFTELLEVINSKIQAGYPITNHGFVKRYDLIKIYQSSAYLIFPSLAESFGLGIVEAIENGCKVMGADLPYTYAVCKPSLIFDPLDVDDMVKAFKESQGDDVKPTVQLMFNQINQIVKLLEK